MTSYNPSTRDIVTEGTGENTESEKEFIYNTYIELLGNKDTETYIRHNKVIDTVMKFAIKN